MSPHDLSDAISLGAEVLGMMPAGKAGMEAEIARLDLLEREESAIMAAAHPDEYTTENAAGEEDKEDPEYYRGLLKVFCGICEASSPLWCYTHICDRSKLRRFRILQ